MKTEAIGYFKTTKIDLAYQWSDAQRFIWSLMTFCSFRFSAHSVYFSRMSHWSRFSLLNTSQMLRLWWWIKNLNKPKELPVVQQFDFTLSVTTPPLLFYLFSTRKKQIDIKTIPMDFVER